jgi:hypothetical protein
MTAVVDNSAAMICPLHKRRSTFMTAASPCRIEIGDQRMEMRQ